MISKFADVFMESKTKPITNHFPYCPKKYQAREYREPRIVAEVCAHNPHILCLQEVSYKSVMNCICYDLIKKEQIISAHLLFNLVG